MRGMLDCMGITSNLALRGLCLPDYKCRDTYLGRRGRKTVSVLRMYNISKSYQWPARSRTVARASCTLLPMTSVCSMSVYHSGKQFVKTAVNPLCQHEQAGSAALTASRSCATHRPEAKLSQPLLCRMAPLDYIIGLHAMGSPALPKQSSPGYLAYYVLVRRQLIALCYRSKFSPRS
jgi:hypothetical protein